MPPSSYAIYSPYDSPLHVGYAGESYILEPNTVTHLDAKFAKGKPLHELKQFLLSSYGSFGLTDVSGLSGPALQQALVGAEDRHTKAHFNHHSAVVSGWLKANRDKLDAGILLEKPNDVLESEAWLRKRGYLK